MARNDDKPSVKTYADHQVITPPHQLRKAIVHVADPDDDPVGRAEAALAQLADQFEGWMQAECERLEAARQGVKRSGFNKQTHDALFRAAHDIKGEAETFGYPAIGAVAGSLCRLIEHTADMTRIPLTLVEQHVDAMRAMVREHTHNDRAAIADELTRRLREITDEFLRAQNGGGPDYLAGILTPPLMP
jgi:chemotaxis protein histidine kinase CheA